MEENIEQRNKEKSTATTEPVRSRWTPKPEQILILESIFNSGMVNPPKDDTIRIRKLLEKFGSVGDANVFYWFQNRRSRSRRRQRQLQATLAERATGLQINNQSSTYDHHQFSSMGGGFVNSSSNINPPLMETQNFYDDHHLVGSSSSTSNCGHHHENLYTQLGFQDLQDQGGSSYLCPNSETPNLHYQSGFITVYINGVATEIPRGKDVDMKAMFGDIDEDLVLVHSSGVPVPVNAFGFLMVTTLHNGESYFLVSRKT